MAFRLNDYVIRGELNNTKNYSTFGRLEIVGSETPIMLELTGNCDPDLQGQRFSFEAVPPPATPKKKPPKMAQHLIGVTGTMTAAGWVRTYECSDEEFYRRARTGEQPPTTWKRHLYLEFFCQHGRTVLEMAGPVLEVHVGGKDDDEDWRPLPEVKPAPTPEEERRMMEQAAQAGPSIDMVHQSGEVERIDPSQYLEERRGGEEKSDLQRQLDAQAAAVDRAIGAQSDDESDLIAEMELMDYLIDHEPGDPLSLAFQTPRRLPAADDIPEAKVEPLFKALLAELALRGVALHVCPHYTPRDAYRLLVEKIGTEWTFHPQLAGTGWVQNYTTSDYCPTCEEETLRDYEAFNEKFEKESQQRELDQDSELPDEEAPF